jgi:pimeloyl-ACP methyl ester carboxylesterase
MKDHRLHFRAYGTGPPLILLHGLFGSGENWHTVANALSTEMRVYAVDQRNHGRSFHSERHDYASLAADILAFIADQHLAPATLLGHSMGGKAAIQAAAAHPEQVERLIVVDITHLAARGIQAEAVAALARLVLDRLATLADAEEKLRPGIPDTALRRFLLKNLERTPEGRYRWKINLEALGRNLDRMGAAVPAAVFRKPCLFIRGARSDYIADADWPEIKSIFPAAEMATLADAGHWVHADAREAFVAAVLDFIRRTGR